MSTSSSSSDHESFQSASAGYKTPPPGSETDPSESVASTVKARHPNAEFAVSQTSGGVPGDNNLLQSSTPALSVKPNPRLPWQTNLPVVPQARIYAIPTSSVADHLSSVQRVDQSRPPTLAQKEPDTIPGPRGRSGKKVAFRSHSDSPKWYTGIRLNELQPTESQQTNAASTTRPTEDMPDTREGELGTALIFRPPDPPRPPLRPRVITGFVNPAWVDVTPYPSNSPHEHPPQGNASSPNQAPGNRLTSPGGREADSLPADEYSPLVEVTRSIVYHHISGGVTGKGSSPELDFQIDQGEPSGATEDIEVDPSPIHALRRDPIPEAGQSIQVQTSPGDATVTALTQKLDVLCDDINAGFDKMAAAIGDLASAVSGPETASRRASSAGGSQTLRRSSEANELAKSVREFLDQHLVGGGDFHTVTREEALDFAAAWSANGGESSLLSCTLDHFRVDLLGKPHSPWNRSAARVFADAFIHAHNLDRTPDAIDDVSRCFFSRIKSMKAKSKLKLSGSVVINEHSRTGRRHQRKRNLFVRRLETAQLHPRLQKHVHMLQRLGTDGMSSDESEDEDTHIRSAARLDNPRFKILEPRWRARQLTIWLRVIDSIHLVSRRCGDKSARGAYPRLRISNERAPEYSKSKKFVKGLPENAYDTIWLHEQYDAYVNVRPSPERYDFNHSGELFEYIRGSN
ncbi:hypothetical protein BD779DRAFT_1675976 [Infundibulicybe gibba]|nr:hypothetical protein BD779DRAFT_1675976 [Infundibulicybe gibba]